MHTFGQPNFELWEDDHVKHLKYFQIYKDKWYCYVQMLYIAMSSFV